METRKGLDIFEVLGWILALVVGILSGLLIREWMEKRRKKRGGKRRQVKKS